MQKLLNDKIKVALLLSVFLVSCATSNKQPRWLDTLLLEYPAELYLSAVGEAEDRKTAGDRARANLSHIFKVAIDDSSVDFAEAIVKSNDGLIEVVNNQRASRQVSVQARQLLEGSRIVQYWVDEITGKVHSFAVLEKASANRRFREDVRSADRKIADLVSFASNDASNPATALRALEQARQNQFERDNANRNLMVTAARGIDSRYRNTQIETMIRQALSRLQFSLDAEKTMNIADVENAMAALGIAVNPRSTHRLSSLLDVEPVQQIQGWFWLRGSVELSLESDNETIAKQRWPLKVSAMDEGLLAQRAKDEINRKLSGYLYQMLTQAPEK